MRPSPETLNIPHGEEEIAPHEVEREEILDRLERRADTIFSIQKELATIEANFPNDKFFRLMYEKFNELASNATDAGRHGFDRVQEIRDRRYQLLTKKSGADFRERMDILRQQE